MTEKRLLNRMCSPSLCRGACTSVPVGENILEADKQLSIHVQFVDSGIDGVSTWSITIESVSIGNGQEDSAADLEHFPVCGTKCLDWQQEKNHPLGLFVSTVKYSRHIQQWILILNWLNQIILMTDWINSFRT